MPQVRTTVVVEWDQKIATWCNLNIPVPVLTLDLLRVKEVHAARKPFLPLHSVQTSSPCTDFLTAGNGVEEESAFHGDIDHDCIKTRHTTHSLRECATHDAIECLGHGGGITGCSGLHLELGHRERH